MSKLCLVFPYLVRCPGKCSHIYLFCCVERVTLYGYYKSTPLFLSFKCFLSYSSPVFINVFFSSHSPNFNFVVFNFLKVVRKVELQVGRCQIRLVGETLGQL